MREDDHFPNLRVDSQAVVLYEKTPAAELGIDGRGELGRKGGLASEAQTCRVAVSGKNLHRDRGLETGLVLGDEECDRIGILAAGTARDPDTYRPVDRAAFEEMRNHFGL